MAEKHSESEGAHRPSRMVTERNELCLQRTIPSGHVLSDEHTLASFDASMHVPSSQRT